MARKKGRKQTLERPSGAQYGDDDFDYRQGASMKYSTYEDIGLDAEDEFHGQREEIDLDESLLRRRRDNASDSEEEVYGLDVEDDLDEEEDDDEKLLEKLTRDQKVRTSDDEEEDGEEGEGDDDKAWGTRRGLFYDADEASDEEEAREEEQEALRLQRLQASKMRPEDFLDDFADSLGARAATDAKSSTLATPDTLDDIDHLAISSSLPLHLLPSTTSAELEVVEKGTSGMSEEERLRLAESSIPEVVQLLGEFERRWGELQERVGPAVRWSVKEGKGSGDAEKYLQMKYRLLISYLTNLSFYLSLRAFPPPATDVTTHPVVDTLVSLQELLDALETKIEGKIAVSDDESEDEDGEEDAAERRKRNKRRRKERRRMEKEAEGMKGFMEEVEEIIRRAGEGGMEEEVEEEGVDGMEVDEVVQTVVNGKKEKKSKSKKSANTAKSSSDVMKPKTAGTQVKVRKGLTEADLVIPEVDYQPVEKEVKPKKKKKSKKKDVSDFGEGDGLEDVDYEDKVEKKRSLQFHVTRVDQTIAARKRKTAGLGDEDIPYRDRFGKIIKPTSEPKLSTPTPQPSTDDVEESPLDYDAIAASLAAEDAAIMKKRKRGGEEEDDGGSDLDGGFGGSDGGSGSGEGEEDDEGALAYYENIKNRRADKKVRREMAVQEAKAALEEDTSMYDENDLTDPSAKRAASYQILKNKGLTPHRNKLQRNPRLKKRVKYEKAKKRLGSYRAVAVDRSKVGAYSGEKSGIKKDLAKGIRFQ
ncbi:hypothetical protein HK097_009399 [Rhizophlyctis rosea]|uniref:Sas10 C-terminal domain-containing protein n=1 Tax=Rhizophlyctis rosea TaxID=64517 RepID=A0AAD5SC21_9FUNG|nr:hypothetical protein HK097_009399 [Rhizophlyctis rosea]